MCSVPVEPRKSLAKMRALKRLAGPMRAAVLDASGGCEEVFAEVLYHLFDVRPERAGVCVRIF